METKIIQISKIGITINLEKIDIYLSRYIQIYEDRHRSFNINTYLDMIEMDLSKGAQIF